MVEERSEKTLGARILFAPGAGAPSTSGWMTAFAERLASLGEVTRFDYPYMKEGKKRPDPQETLIARHREALAALRLQGRGPLVLMGKSMGSRMGCHVALEEADVAALVCFGYPLRAPKTGAMRDKVLLALRTPILFVQGTRDPLCPLDDLEVVRAKMPAPNTLYVVEGGDHSLLVTAKERKAKGETQGDVDARILGVVRAFLEETLRA